MTDIEIREGLGLGVALGVALGDLTTVRVDLLKELIAERDSLKAQLAWLESRFWRHPGHPSFKPGETRWYWPQAAVLGDGKDFRSAIDAARAAEEVEKEKESGGWKKEVEI